MITMDRNSKWRMNDLVFTKNCAICDIKVEWQHDEPVHNNQNNFYKHLYNKGWQKKRLSFLGGREWVCEKHR